MKVGLLAAILMFWTSGGSALSGFPSNSPSLLSSDEDEPSFIHMWDNPGLFWWILQLLVPESYVDSNVFFYLYSRSNIWAPIELQIGQPLADPAFDFDKKTVIFVHGFRTDFQGPAPSAMKNGFLTNTDYNVIIVDYGNLNSDSIFSFFTTLIFSYKISQFVGRFVNYIIDQKVDPDKIHLLGHSLGAHIAGLAGKYVNRQGKYIQRITGLDPCYAGYNKNSETYRLAATDANFTDCITTSFGSLGYDVPLCQANFYPNGISGGQPGCSFGDVSCCHSRVIDLYVESTEVNSNFSVMECSRVPQSSNECWPVGNTVMGEYADPRMSGIFYLTTNAQYPFSRG